MGIVSKLAVKAAKDLAVKPSRFLRASEEPVVTQAARLGLPLGGAEQMRVAHPGPFGPYASIKPRTPLDELNINTTPSHNIDPKPFNPEDFEHAMIVPLIGDRSIAGKNIKGVGGLSVDVPTYGGPMFGEHQKAMGADAVWAAEKPQISVLKRQASKGFDEGRNVFGVYSAMGPEAGDQNTMMTDLLLQKIAQSDIAKKDIKAFDRSIKNFVPDFPGVTHPDAYTVLAAQPQGTRKKFVETMDKAPWLAKGFPDVGAARVALTEPGLREMPAGSSGFAVVRLTPDSIKDTDFKIPHPTYSSQIKGEAVGGLDRQVPFNLMWPDFIADRRARGAPAARDLRAMEFSKPYQVFRPENLDKLMQYLEVSKNRYRRGGRVKTKSR